MNQNKWITILAGLSGGAAIGLGVAEASVVTGVVATVSPEAAAYASIVGSAVGGFLGFFAKKKNEDLGNGQDKDTK